jgi:single-strand DNA-binding protein
MAQAGINTVVIAGNLVRDAELKYTNGGLAICEFSVAVNDQKKQGDQWVEEAYFFDVTPLRSAGGIPAALPDQRENGWCRG